MQNELRRSVGEVVREWRTAAGMRQGRLAALCQMEQSGLSRLEAGRILPSLDVLVRIADALGRCPGDMVAEAHRRSNGHMPPSEAAKWARVHAINASKIAASGAGQNRRR